MTNHDIVALNESESANEGSRLPFVSSTQGELRNPRCNSLNESTPTSKLFRKNFENLLLICRACSLTESPDWPHLYLELKFRC